MLKRYGSCRIIMEEDLSVVYNVGYRTRTNVLQRIRAEACRVTWHKALRRSIRGIQNGALKSRGIP